MRRRTYLRASTAGLVGLGVLAGCSGKQKAPPRQSEVFRELSVSEGTLQIPLEPDPVVESRADISPTQGDIEPNVDTGNLAPVGAAKAGGRGGRGGRGSGATGRGAGGYSSAPKGRHGRAIYHGHDDDDEWRRNHRDDVDEYSAVHKTVAIGFLGSAASYRNNPPGPGPVDWDETWTDPDSNTLQYQNVEEGWHRVGSRLTAENADHDFGWEATDFKVDRETGGYDVERPWKVSPRL